MAEITAALVKELREMTGAGMMECKKALVEAEGDDQHDDEKQQIDQHQAGKVEQTPEAAKQPPQTFENRHSRANALLMGREGHY